MQHSQHRSLVWLSVIIATFFVLDCFSLHTGDDLGYMFADTTHHCGDGVRVTSLWQCFTTQCHHYVTTNGRFAVHVVVMALLNLVPLWVFRVLNALMFGALWYLATRFVPAERRTNTLYAVTWMLLLVALPQPGVVLLTLVSYAVNYLWVAVAVLALLLFMQRKPDSRWLIVYAFVVGTLQESFSLPLCAGLVVATIMRRAPLAATYSFIVGTAVEVFAPGNMAHAAQGGGFSLAAITAKLTALGEDLLFSPISYALIAGVIWYVCRRKECSTFIKENIIFVVGIVAALALAALTFTSPRQLTAPTLFTIILLLKLIPSRRWLTVGATVATFAVIIAMGIYKYQIHERYNSLLDNVAANKSYAYPTGLPVCTANNAVTRAFIPDPLCNRALVTVGDKYTKRGLQRLRNKASLCNLLPYEPSYIVKNVKPHLSEHDGKIIARTTQLGAYSIAAMPESVFYGYSIAPRTNYELLSVGGTIYLTLPKRQPSITLVRR